MLEFLLLHVVHDGFRFCILFYRHALLIPVDRLRFFDHREDHAREGARLLRQLVRRLVILIESDVLNYLSFTN